MTTPPPLEAARERVVDLLSAHFAHDGIPVEELDRRLDAVYQATSLLELEALVRDVPNGQAALMRVSAPHPALYEDEGAEIAGEESERVLSVLSSTQRTGLWVVPRQLELVSVASETVLDLREASLAPGVTDIDVSAFMTQVTIIVPRDVRVVNRLFALLAATHDRSVPEIDPGREARVVRVDGWSVLAEVVIKRA